MTLLRATMVMVLLALALGAAAQAVTAVSSGAVCKPGDPCGPPPRYSCTKTTQPITVDGRLDEAAWSRAVVFRDFHLTDGVQRPTFRTEFRALWDDQNLYLAYVCSDPKIVASGRMTASRPSSPPGTRWGGTTSSRSARATCSSTPPSS